MKRYILFLLLFFTALLFADGLMTFKIIDENNDYWGFDNIQFYKKAQYDTGSDTIPIYYYLFHSERFARYYVNGVPASSSLDINTDYLIKGMIIVDAKDNLVFFKSEETLIDFKKQHRTIKITYDFKNKGYLVNIEDPNRLKKEIVYNNFIKSEPLPVIDDFKSFDYLYLLKNKFSSKQKTVKGLMVFHWAMVQRQSLTFVNIIPGEGDFNPPTGKTKFYPLEPKIFDIKITNNGKEYYFTNFSLSVTKP
ncbi:hypothetical protein J7L48_05870 [bacterium]|nr:hypothetical protein [bacterium]